MSEMSDMFKLVNQMELAKKARVGMSLTYFDVIELLGELESLYEYIDELEEARRWRVVADGELPDKNDTVLVFSANESESSPAIAVFYDCEWTEWIVNSRFLKSSDVTHWMPRPESPNDTQTETFVCGKESEE